MAGIPNILDFFAPQAQPQGGLLAPGMFMDPRQSALLALGGQLLQNAAPSPMPQGMLTGAPEALMGGYQSGLQNLMAQQQIEEAQRQRGAQKTLFESLSGQPGMENAALAMQAGFPPDAFMPQPTSYPSDVEVALFEANGDIDRAREILRGTRTAGELDASVEAELQRLAVTRARREEEEAVREVSAEDKAIEVATRNAVQAAGQMRNIMERWRGSALAFGTPFSQSYDEAVAALAAGRQIFGMDTNELQRFVTDMQTFDSLATVAGVRLIDALWDRGAINLTEYNQMMEAAPTRDVSRGANRVRIVDTIQRALDVAEIRDVPLPPALRTAATEMLQTLRGAGGASVPQGGPPIAAPTTVEAARAMSPGDASRIPLDVMIDLYQNSPEIYNILISKSADALAP